MSENDIKGDLATKVKGVFDLPDGAEDSIEVGQMSKIISEYLYEELGVYEPEEVLSTMMHIMRENEISGQHGSQQLENFTKFILSQKKERKLREIIDQYGKYGTTKKFG